MKNVRTLRKRRAVSPVIATVIIVAVTITVAVAASYWISGISSQYTSFEKVEIQSAVFTPGTLDIVPPFWEIIITLKNSGTKTASLTSVYVNDVLAGPGSYETSPYMPTIVGITASVDAITPISIDSGDTGEVTVWILPGLIPGGGSSYITLSSGTTVNIKIHSAGGMDYIRLVQLT